MKAMHQFDLLFYCWPYYFKLILWDVVLLVVKKGKNKDRSLKFFQIVVKL